MKGDGGPEGLRVWLLPVWLLLNELWLVRNADGDADDACPVSSDPPPPNPPPNPDPNKGVPALTEETSAPPPLLLVRIRSSAFVSSPLFPGESAARSPTMPRNAGLAARPSLASTPPPTLSGDTLEGSKGGFPALCTADSVAEFSGEIWCWPAGERDTSPPSSRERSSSTEPRFELGFGCVHAYPRSMPTEGRPDSARS